MRVLHVITGLAPGGAEQQLRLLLRHLPAECAVATLTNPGAVATAIRDEGTPVVDLGMRHNRDVAVLPRLVRLIKAGHYDLVHTHLYRACVYGRLAARLAGVPRIVATEHSLGARSIEGRRTSPGVRALYLATERLGDATIAVSSTVARRLVGWGVRPGRVVVLPNGVDAGDFSYDPALRQAARARLGLSPGDRVVGAVGRLTPAKRFDVLVQALSAIDGARLLLVGDGPERAALEELARASGVLPRVRFAGAAMDVRALLCAMDVFASPSAEETFGLAVLEALACGLPVRYVSCPALEELPQSAAPYARRLRLDAERFRDELAAALRDPRHRPPPVVSYYDIAQLADRVAQLYELVQAGAPITTPRPEAHPVAPSGRFTWLP
jgi:glycosyltransferase involved in cell wall biosynthesis